MVNATLHPTTNARNLAAGRQDDKPPKTPGIETMKMRLVATLIGLANGLALQGIAQEQKPVDPEVRQQIEPET